MTAHFDLGRARLVALAALALCALGVAWLLVSGGTSARTAAAPPALRVREEPVEEPVFGFGPRHEVPLDAGEPAQAPVAAHVLDDAAATELTEEEIEALRAEAPPSSLEVLVFAGREPVEGAAVVAKPFVLEEMPDLSRPLDGDLAQRTNARGLAVFTALEPDYYLVNVRAKGGLASWLLVWVDDDKSSERVLVLFGEGGIRGHVYRTDGSPWAGTIVFAGYSGPVGRNLIPSATTGGDGSYVLGGMPSGTLRVQDLDLQENRAQRYLEFTLAPGEWREVDFGSRRGATRWRGALTSTSGEPLSIPGRFELRDEASGVRTGVAFDERGRFDYATDRATYEAALQGFTGRLSMGSVVVDGEELERDLVVPGISVGGRIRYVGSRTPPEREAQTAEVWLEREDGVSSPAGLRGGDRYAFLGLEAGSYTLRVQPHALVGAPLGRLTVRLAPGVASETIDLEITDP